MQQNTTLGRLAPTPSGHMHLGNLFSALLVWLSAKSQGGRLIFRVEDLDPQRTSPAFAQGIMDDLRWLGLDWDEGPTLQSERTAFYERCAQKLAAQGLVYPCFCSRAELHAAEAPHLSDGVYLYGGKCRALSPAEVAEKAKRRSPALRLRVPDETVAFTDGCQGPYAQNLEKEAGDFILRRSDGVFAYQLAAPADDGDMGVTEVVRGRDLLSSAPRQIWLIRQLGYRPPRYCHHPLLLAPDGRRLAKRDGDTDLRALRAAGVRPEALLGLLGHLAGLLEAPRPTAVAELAGLFSWDKIRKEDIVVAPEMLAGLQGD